MKQRQFLKLLRDYAELARRMKRDYGEQIDTAASLYLSKSGLEGDAFDQLRDDTMRLVDREYDPIWRNYPKP